MAVATKSKKGVKSKSRKSTNGQVSPSIWLQFPVVDENERHMIHEARKRRKFKSLAEYSRALIIADCGKLKLN